MMIPWETPGDVLVGTVLLFTGLILLGIAVDDGREWLRRRRGGKR